MTWTTTTQYVDHETGEVLIKYQIDKGHYVKLKCTTNYEKINDFYGYRRITWQCERNRQHTLW